MSDQDQTLWDSIFDAIPAPACVLDKDRVILRANKALAAYCGRRRQDLPGKTCYRAIHNSQAPCLQCPFMHSVNHRRTCEKEIRHPESGQAVLTGTAPLFDSMGNVKGCLHLFRPQKGAESPFINDQEGATREQESLLLSQLPLKNPNPVFRALFEMAPIGMGLLNLSGRFIKVNNKLCALLGYSREELLKRNLRDFTHPQDMAEEKRLLKLIEEEAIKKHSAELEAINKELESFAYSVSHDLHAPLRAIKGFSRILLEEYGETLPLSALDYLRRIEDASRDMGDLIDRLLELSRVGSREIKRETVNLSSIARSALRHLQEEWPQRRVIVDIQPTADTAGDPQLLTTLVKNLLENAWKFTSRREEGKIEFGALSRKKRPIYFVRDNGAGFSMTEKDKLFQPFRRLHPDREFPGTGIGLATAERIIKRHGGRIWARGRPGEGAAFFFTL